MIIIAIGANLPSRFGTPAETIHKAVAALGEQGLKTGAMSRIWLTAPVPVSDQPWYHNAVVAVETELDAFQLLSLLHKIESDFGRVRYERNEPRVIDLDLVAYNDEIINRPSLIVPHPRMHERAFVLLPIKDIEPNWTHPISGLGLDALISAMPAGQEAKPHG